MGFWTGFMQRAGEHAREQDMLELQQAQEQKKNLYDFYTKMMEHPDLRDERRQEIMNNAQQILQVQPGKKIPKQLYPEALLSGGSLFYSQGEKDTRAAEAEALKARRVQESTLPAKTEAQAYLNLSKLEGQPNKLTKRKGDELLAEGIKATTGGIPIEPDKLYNHQDYKHYPMFGERGKESLVFEEGDPNAKTITTTLMDENGIPYTTQMLVNLSTGTARPLQQEGGGGAITGMASPGYYPSQRTSTKTESAMAPGVSTTSSGYRKNLPQSSQFNLGEMQQYAPPVPAPPSTPTQPSMQTPYMQPTNLQGQPQQTLSGQLFPVGANQLPQSAMASLRQTTARIAAQPKTDLQNFLAKFKDMSRPAGVKQADPTAAFQRTIGTTAQMAALPTEAQVNSSDPTVSGPAKDEYQNALTAYRSTLNLYPSDFWSAEINKIKLNKQDEPYRASILEAVRQGLDNPRLFEVDDNYKGKPGLVIKNAMRSAGIPVPAKLTAQESDKVGFALISLEAIRDIRQVALHNPKLLGMVQGRVNELVGRVGTNAWRDSVDAYTAQYILTRCQYFMTMEAKVLMGARPAVSFIEDLKQVTANDRMTLQQLTASLDAAERHAYLAIDQAAHSQWGARVKDMMHSPKAPWMPGSPQVGDVRLARGNQYQIVMQSKQYPGKLVWANVDRLITQGGKAKPVNPRPAELIFDPHASTLKAAQSGKDTMPRPKPTTQKK